MIADLLRCVDPGKELGLELGATYALVRRLDPWTVAVRSLRAPHVSPEHYLDTWERLVLPEPELLSPRCAGRFVPLNNDPDQMLIDGDPGEP